MVSGWGVISFSTVLDGSFALSVGRFTCTTICVVRFSGQGGHLNVKLVFYVPGTVLCVGHTWIAAMDGDYWVPRIVFWVYYLICASGGRMSAVNVILQHTRLCYCVLGILGFSVHSCGPGQFSWASFPMSVRLRHNNSKHGLACVSLLSLLCFLYCVTGQIFRGNSATPVPLVRLRWCWKNCLDWSFMSRQKRSVILVVRSANHRFLEIL